MNTKLRAWQANNIFIFTRYTKVVSCLVPDILAIQEG